MILTFDSCVVIMIEMGNGREEWNRKRNKRFVRSPIQFNSNCLFQYS